MEVDWSDSDPEDKSEDGDETEGVLNEEEELDEILPLENEEDVSLEVDAIDAWNMIHGLETEE
ncbi:hypothetical protein FRC12_002692 [Ceratobasidium sp. 428]|nr:hypothetical protein FRC12_002692 [Ceratobasidium sp. 428]